MNTTSEFIALVGRPNVGKSSLLNRLVGEKVAIVTEKPQTTRTRITGVLTRGENQMVFIDTPGMHRPRTKLSEYMVRQVKESVGDVDAAVLVTDCGSEIYAAERELAAGIAERRLPAVLVINKVDTLERKEPLLDKISAFSQLLPFEAVIPLSAKTGEGCEELLDELGRFAKPGPHYFSEDSYTDQPERVIAAEMIREKLLQNLRDEIPHGTAVEIERMRERDDGQIVDIDATIYCEKASHKGMIIGKGGQMLKKIATQSRQELENFLDIRVNLQCWVKVREDWRNSESMMKNFGFR